MKLDFLKWLESAAAGFSLHGSSGTGKSQLMRLMICQLARAGRGAWLLDPSGDLVADLERDLSSFPKSVRDRLIVIRPFDVRNGVIAPNPLHVPDTGDPVRWRAKLATKVKHVAYILLRAWGETDFNSKPVMFKWVTRFLMLLALARLPISAVRYFFDTGHSVFQALARVSPDFVVQTEMEELAGLKPKDREDIIASSKNRFLGMLSNPIVELLLSVTDTAVDVRRWIAEDKIVLISLETGEGEFDDSDVEILANIWLSEILFAVFNTPREERRWTTVFIDELPLFKSSFPLLQKSMPLVRKLKLRWVTADQGAYVYPDAQEDRLLNLIIGQCRFHFIFGLGNFRDAEFFARVAKYGKIDLRRTKHIEVSPSQLTVGHQLRHLYDEAVNWSEADQEGSSSARATNESTSSGTQSGTQSGESRQLDWERGFHEVVTRSRGEAERSTRQQSSGSTDTETDSQSHTSSKGGSRTKKQTLVPVYKTHLSKQITWMTTEEQFTETASKIVDFPVGRCIIHGRGFGAWIVQLPMVRNRYEGTPRYAAKKLLELLEQLRRLPYAFSVEEITKESEQLALSLVEQLNALTHQGVRIDSQQIALRHTQHDNPDLTI